MIIVKEDYDRRGRAPGEMASLIFRNIKNSQKELFIDERDAMKRALEISEEGDLIIVFYEDREKVLSVIEKCKNDNLVENNVKNNLQ